MLYDADIREPLFAFLEETYDPIRILEEKRVGRSRADVMMILPGRVCGLEIKSDADTYARLETQVRDYNTYFDENIIAVGSRHAAHVAEHVPDWWGIITVEEADGKPDFYMLRKPGRNPEDNLAGKLSLLWRPELVWIQNVNDLPAWKEKSKKFVAQKLVERVAKERLDEQISQALFERDYTTITEEINAYRALQGRRPRTVRRKRKKRG